MSKKKYLKLLDTIDKSVLLVLRKQIHTRIGQRERELTFPELGDGTQSFFREKYSHRGINHGFLFLLGVCISDILGSSETATFSVAAELRT